MAVAKKRLWWHGRDTRERYISDGTWFDIGTEALIVDDYRTECPHAIGLFEGFHEGMIDQEVCGFDEFFVLGHHSE